METTGPHVPPTPPSEPPASGPPAGPWRSSTPPGQSDDVSVVDVRVTKRLLWVGEACYPLANITRLHGHTVRPRRNEAFNKFLLQLVLTVLAVGLLGSAADDSSSDDEFMRVVLYVAAGFLTYALVRLCTVLFSRTYHVLTISTAGTAYALLTARESGVLREVRHQISHAIENPGAEFRMRVQHLAINPKNYNFGDTVNMNGGTKNTGVSK